MPADRQAEAVALLAKVGFSTSPTTAATGLVATTASPDSSPATGSEWQCRGI